MTKKGYIPWWCLKDDEVKRELFLGALRESYQEQTGNYGKCTCDRPGYQRSNPSICRHCNKPMSVITILIHKT